MSSSSLDTDTVAVSEVIGQILIFGILSTVLVLTLVGFNVAKDNAEGRAMELRAESAAQRVAAVAVQAALYAEENSDRTIRFTGLVDLAQDMEGRAYWIDLDEDTVTVTIPDTGVSIPVRLLRVSADPDLVVCDQPVLPGGPVQVVMETVSVPPADCSNYAGQSLVLRLEAAS